MTWDHVAHNCTIKTLLLRLSTALYKTARSTEGEQQRKATAAVWKRRKAAEGLTSWLTA